MTKTGDTTLTAQQIVRASKCLVEADELFPDLTVSKHFGGIFEFCYHSLATGVGVLLLKINSGKSLNPFGTSTGCAIDICLKKMGKVQLPLIFKSDYLTVTCF